MDGLKRLIGEVHRRSLWQVLGIYIAGSWAALQAVDVLAESAGLPEWFPSLALGLLIIGLPIVLATAFVQEGLGREPHPPAAGDAATRASGRTAPVAPASARRLFTWRNALLGGVGAFALWGVVAAGWVMVGGTLAADSSPIDGAGRGQSEHGRNLLPTVGASTRHLLTAVGHSRSRGARHAHQPSARGSVCPGKQVAGMCASRGGTRRRLPSGA